MTKKTKPLPVPRTLVVTEEYLDKVRECLVRGDIGEAAPYAFVAAKAALCLATDLAFDQGVKGGLARAQQNRLKSNRLRKRQRPQ